MLQTKAFAMAAGIICGLFILLFGWAGAMLNWGNELANLWGTVYIGFGSTFLGGIVGAIWGFADGFIGGYLFARLYNKFEK